jgi:hypothetical protein
MMKRMTAILAATLLASTLFTAAAEARGGGGHMGGFGGGVHFGGLGAGAHVGRIGGGGFGGGMTGHVGIDGPRSALGHRLEEGESLGCSQSNLLHTGQPLSPGCG